MNIDEFRTKLALFVHECIDELGISERTWYRWVQQNCAPEWAYKLLRYRAGHLDGMGWKQWQIREGILYFDGFKSHAYQWEPGELLANHWTRHNTRDIDRMEKERKAAEALFQACIDKSVPLAGGAGVRGEKPSPHPSQRVLLSCP